MKKYLQQTKHSKMDNKKHGVTWFRKQENNKRESCMTCHQITDIGNCIEVDTDYVKKHFWYCLPCYSKIKSNEELPTLIFKWMNIKSVSDISLYCYNCGNTVNTEFLNKDDKINNLVCDLCNQKGAVRIYIKS